jgi:hypothetical protein
LNLGYPAVGVITSREEICLAILALATIIGTIVQLWLLPKISTSFTAARQSAKTKVKKVKAQKGDIDAAGKSTTWRTA